MPKENKEQRQQREALEYEKQEDEFDKDRLYFISFFIFRASKYRKIAYSEYGLTYEFKVLDLEDGSFRFTQETSESRDCGAYAVEPSITSDTNSVAYNKALDILNAEIYNIQSKMEERKRIEELKTNALAKLTKEERKVLGI